MGIKKDFFAPLASGLGATRRAAVLLLVMMLTATTAWAQSGSCGDDLTWELTGNTLTISGSGAMANYEKPDDQPWKDYRSSITSVVIGNGVTSIGKYAFSLCTLGSVTFEGSQLTSIGNSAFELCDHLTSITIPASVTSIGEDAFLQCSSLASMAVEAGNTVYDSRNSCNAIIVKSTNTLIFGCKNSTIPDDVTSIGAYAFFAVNLTSVAFPASVTSIERDAFSNCDNLESVTFADGSQLESIGTYAFSECSSLESVTFKGSQLTSIGDYAFRGMNPTSIEIPASVTSIGIRAFQNCPNLATVTVYAPSCSLGDNAFYECNNLENIYVFSNKVESYKGAWSAYAGDIESLTLTANAGDNDGEYWSTYYNDLADSKVGDGTKVFKVALDGTSLTMTEISDGIVTRGQAVVLKSTSNSIPLNYSATGSETSYEDNSLLGTMTGIENPGNAYVLNNKTAGIGFYKLSASGTIGAHKAYLTYDGNNARSFFRLDGTTGVNDVRGKMADGRSEYFDLQGRKLYGKPTVKGIYILNGKAVSVK